MPTDAHDITVLWGERSGFYGNDHKDIDTLVRVYNGDLPSQFKDYFTEDMHVHVPNMIRLSWDDLATMAGKEFPILVEPDNDTATAKARAEKLERIGYHYNEAGRHVGGIDMQQLMKVLSWWMVGTGSAVAMALPSFERRTPFFTFRDPRTFYPPVGWTPYTQAAPGDALFAYQLTLGELKRRYPEAMTSEVARKLQRSAFSPIPSRLDDTSLVWVGEYYHADSWQIVTLTDPTVTLIRSDTGDPGHPDVMPVVPMAMYNPASSKGRSMFADQVSIQAAMARMFSQKLDFYDRTLYPLVFHTPLAGNTLRIGPYATNEYNIASGVPPRVDTIAPAHQIDADQTMQFALALSRILNRNPEALQGAGEANSAKAINELLSGVTRTIRDGIWPSMVAALPRLYEAAARMDVNLWGDVTKKAKGRMKNSSFTINYTPDKDVRGREETFEVEPGLGLAGYQGTLEIMQLYGAELVSEDTALEQIEGVREPQAEKRKIQSDRLGKLIYADLAAKAQSGALAPGALAEIRQRMMAKGEDLFDVLMEMEKAGRLVPPPQALGPGGPGGEVGPGTGPAASFLPLPALEALRGGPGSV